MEHINFVHVEEGSQTFVNLSGIVQSIQGLRNRIQYKHTKKKSYPSKNGEGIYCYVTSLKEDVEYLLKGLENSIEEGYEIAKDDLVTKSPPPDGYAVIAVPVGSLIVPPGKEKEWAEKVLRELPPVIDANGPRILTQGELNQFKKIEEEKTKALEDHLFKSNSAENKSPIELISPYVHKFNEEMAKANKEVYPDDFTLYEALAGKKINYHKVPDLDENKEDNTGQKFPPVMYSQDGRRFEILQISSDPWYRTVSKGTISDAKYTAMLRNGFKPHLPMRSREEIQQKINWSINRTGDAVFEADKQKHRAVADILKWVLNEE